ncbi:MAG: YfhO family protein, partial [Syntrophomonadaceae bacterium]
MLLLVLRSLAVYGLVASALLAAAHRWVRPLGLATALFLAAAPLVFTGRATLRGEVYAPLDIQQWGEPFASESPGVRPAPPRTPLLSDVVYSMIPWQKAVRESLKHARLPLWNRFVLSGEPLLAVQQAAVLHPFTWAGLLLPLGPAWTFQMSARLLLAMLSAFLLARELGCRDAAAFLGAAGWAFSDFVVFWLGYSVGGALAPFPLLLLGLSRLARDADRRAAALTVVALVLIVTAGHPEGLLFAVSGAGVWFLFELALAERARRLRALRLSLLSGALALGLTAVQLLPLAEIVPKTWEHAFRSDFFAHQKKSVPLFESVRHSATDVVPFAFGEPGSGHGGTRPGFDVPAGYAGAIVLPLAVVGLAGSERRRFALLALALLGGAVGARLAGITDVLSGLPFFDIAVTEYLVFLVPFSACALAALGADRLARGQGRGLFAAASTLALAGVAALLLYRSAGLRQLGMAEAHLWRRALLELVPLVAAPLVVAVLGRREARAVPVALAVLLVAARDLEAGALYPSCPERMLAPRVAALDAVPRGEPVRVVGLGDRFVPNVSALYEVEDARGYESLTLRPFVATYPRWCVPQGAWFNRVDDLERPFLSFLNVGYALVPPAFPPPPGWTLAARDPGGDVLRNERRLPRVFVPARIRTDAGILDRLARLETIADFGERGVVGPEAGVPTGEWRDNGAATVSIDRYDGDSLDVRVAAGADAILATSIPAWPGWQARLDGRPIAPIEYNVAFLGFRTPAGDHRLSLRY